MHRCFSGALVLAVPCLADAAPSVQEILLRAKPGVALVVSEVSAEVTVTCPTGGQQRVKPAPFRETGTGWFINPNGWVITNGHVVSAARQPGPSIERELGEPALSAALARAKAKLDPSISVLLSNGMRLSATVAKYSPPVAGEGMSGRDLALLKLEAADMPALTLGDSSSAKIGDRVHILGFPD